MNKDILSLLQNHTRSIYQLDVKSFEVKTIPARELLAVTRFDLFAKIFYIKYRKSNPALAQQVYVEHIKAFNPDLKEPGRTDKCGVDKFLTVFDKLIDDFSTVDFDDAVSIVPVDENNIILDGAHRVAALAYYDKKVTIAKFNDVVSKGLFDYNYFINRGLSIETADLIAFEATNWCKHLYAACLWPKLSKSADRELVKDIIKRDNQLLYEKSTLVSLDHLTQFVAKIYASQDWVGTEENHFSGARDKAMNCYSLSKRLDVIFFQSSLPLEEILKMKENVRGHFSFGKHVIHITDNDVETQFLSSLILDKNQRNLWLKDSGWVSLNKWNEKIKEWLIVFRYNCLIPLKTFVYRLIHSCK